MASAGDDNTVKLWDLRKLKNFATINAEGATAVNFDFSGQFLAVAAGKGVRWGSPSSLYFPRVHVVAPSHI